MDWVKVEFRDLEEVDGFVVESLDDNGCLFYTIVINSRISAEQQRATYYHELNHILREDFERVKLGSVNDIEKEAHHTTCWDRI